MSTGKEGVVNPRLGGGAGSLVTKGMRVCYVGAPNDATAGDASLLANLGAHVDRFNRVEDGFNAVVARDYDLLLVNLTASSDGVAGPDFIRLVRNCGHPAKSGLPIVAIASQRQLAHADKIKALGANELIGTPIDVAVLQDKIIRVLGRHRGRQQPAVGENARAPDALQNNESMRGPRMPNLGAAQSNHPLNKLVQRQPVDDPKSRTPTADMKEKFDLLQPSRTALSNNEDSGVMDRKGLLERLGDRILARLAKNPGNDASVPELPTGPMSSLPSFSANEAAGSVRTKSQSFEFSADADAVPSYRQREEEIKRSLQNLGKLGDSNAAPKGGASEEPSTHQRGVRETQKTATAADRANRGVSSPVSQTAASFADESFSASAPQSGKQPYVSRINKRRPAPSNVVKTESGNRTSRSSEQSAIASLGLSETEKSRVYDRVKQLVSTARRPADASHPTASGSGSVPRAKRKLRVCFLEDSCTSSHAIREMLGEFGHEVDHFSQAEEAFDAFVEKQYDVVLASQIEAIGGMDCEKLVRQIRKSQNIEKRRTPVVVLTANSDPNNLQLFRRAGANDVVVKPVEGKRLHDQINAVLALQPVAAARPRDKKALKVCFLEDSCTSSHAVREMLGEAGHEVDHFSSAEEALDAVMEKPYDVLLASQIVALGGMDCLGLIKTLRADKNAEKKTLPIVALTANADPANLETFYVAGASDVILKPIEGKELNKRIAESVSDHAAAPVVAPINEALRDEAAPTAQRALKVCFLEDSCTSSHAIREMLGERGHEVDHFSSAEEALDAVMEKNYDLLLASQIVALGGMDCEQLVRTLRNSPRREKQQLPIVVITANAAGENIDKFYSAGAQEVVVKPVDAKTLNDRVQNVVSLKSKPVPTAAPQALPRNLKVCFLEDSCTSSHAIREMLGENGHEVDHFSTPEEALDAFIEKDYDVLLASQIPGSGGMDTEALVREVRAVKGAAKQKPVVLLTTDPSAENQQRFRRSGVNDVVAKPVEGNLSLRLLEVVGRRSASAPAPVSAPPPRVPVPKKLHVCFLEDSCTSSHAIREMLGEAGHEVDHFSSAEEALDAFMEKKYDVMLASQVVALGGLDCEGLVKAIRGSSQLPKRQSPVVVITANAEDSNVENFKRLGVDAVIIKPIVGSLGDQLKEIVGAAINQPLRPQLRVVPRELPKRAPTAALAPPPLPPAQNAPAARKQASVAPPRLPVSPVGPAAESFMPPLPPVSRATPEPGAFPFGSPMSIPKQEPAIPQGITNIPGMSGPSLLQGRKIIFAVLVTAGIAGIAAGWHHFGGDVVPVDVAVAERGAIYQSFRATGQVVSKKRVELTTGIPGQIVKVQAKEGDSIKKGQVLATMDERDANIQMQRAAANLESAKKEVVLNERTMDRLVRALQMGAVSRQMAEDAEAAVNAARAKERVAEEEYKAAQLGAERLNVTAPFDGVITASFAIEGLWAEPPGPLFTIVDMSQREVELKIDSSDAARINVGQRVVLTSDAFPEQWTESVVRVAPATNRDNSMANIINVYTSLGPDAPPLRYGMQVDAQIRTSANENAVKVPTAAVTTRNGHSAIAVIEDGRLRYRPVVTGIESVNQVEIREGLKAGDQVIVINKGLDEGVQVKPVEIPG